MKEGSAFALPSFAFIENCLLEIDAQTELNPAAAGGSVCRNKGRRNDSKRREVGQVKIWIQEDRMVEGIEHIGREFGAVAGTPLGKPPKKTPPHKELPDIPPTTVRG